MKISFTLCCVAGLACLATAWAQAPTAAAAAEDPEQHDLTEALGEAGNSSVDFVRALEQHLKKYPEAKDREKIERALVSVDGPRERRFERASTARAEEQPAG